MRVFGLSFRLALSTIWLASLACSANTQSGAEKEGKGGASTGTGGSSNGQSGGNGEAGGMNSSSGGSGSGVVTGSGGTSASSGSGGKSGGQSGSSSQSSSGGTGGVRANSYMGHGGAVVLLKPSAGAGGADICGELSVVPKPVVPTVLILVDNSSSMFEPRAELWDLLYTTLMDPTKGVVPPLQSKVRFGFASFKGNTSSTAETDPTCAQITSVPYALDNYDKINQTYTQLGAEWKDGVKWETPTGHAINAVAADLAKYTPDPPGPKYILLVTDGNPNTCKVVDPQCGQDLSIRAVQDAKAQGIGTFAVGIGDIVSKNSGCETSWGRCGKDHLQDLANAGQGLPVAEPPATYVYQSCADAYGRVLQGSYAQTGDTPGTAPYFTATNGTQLRDALQGLLNSVVSCTFDMDAIVTGNPALGSVTVGSQAATYNNADGWRLESNKYQVTLQGDSCKQFQSGKYDLHITFPCDPVTGMPIAVKR